jgi:hypothetical protein
LRAGSDAVANFNQTLGASMKKIIAAILAGLFATVTVGAIAAKHEGGGDMKKEQKKEEKKDGSGKK